MRNLNSKRVGIQNNIPAKIDKEMRNLNSKKVSIRKDIPAKILKKFPSLTALVLQNFSTKF